MESRLTTGSKKILIINLGGIGDFLLSTPALRALRILYPKDEISILISLKVYELAEDSPYIDNAYSFDIGYGGIIHFGKILNNTKVLLTLRKEHFNLAINMRTLVSETSAKKIKLLLDIIKPQKRVGRDTEGRGYFFDIKIPETGWAEKYEMEYDIDTVKALGGRVNDRTIDLNIEKKSIEKVARILEKNNISKDTILIGIHPGGMPSRRWPIENYSYMINEVYRNISCRFVISGGRDEIDLVNKLSRSTNIEIINLVDELNIQELAALIKRCSLFVTNDTGPMHIAAVLKTPLVAIFGPGDIIRFNPRNISDKAIVLYKKVECAPCNRVSCNDLKCLEIISSREVVEAVLKMVSNNTNA